MSHHCIELSEVLDIREISVNFDTIRHARPGLFNDSSKIDKSLMSLVTKVPSNQFAASRIYWDLS